MPVDDFFSTDTGSSTTGTTTTVLTVPRGVAIGKKLVVAHGRSDVAGNSLTGLSSVSDSKGNTWVVSDPVSIRANQGAVAFAHSDVSTALVAGDTITVTMPATAARKFMDVWVCSGLAAGGPDSGSGSAATANTNSNANGASVAASASFTQVAPTALVLVAGYFGSVGVPATAASGYILDSTRATTDGAPKGWASAHGLITGSGAHTATLNQAASSAWAAAAVAFASSGNNVPVANAGVDQTNIDAGTLVTLDGSGSTDADGTVTGYSWRLVTRSPTGGPIPVLSSTTAQNPTWTAPPWTADVVYTWGLTVTDNLGASSTEDTVTDSVLQTADAILRPGGWTPVAWNIIR